ncbi:MAG: hypothetical protein LBF15_03790 [Candidatus Peribacteria bacterium]|jgi:hypothetical protein|nr:hypothetical protein [Candidatus Peribacteria bacterium]
MKDNLEAKFKKEVLEATVLVLPEIKEIEFRVDLNIDNPSNVNVIDCANFYKDSSKSKTKKISKEDGTTMSLKQDK